MGAFLSTDFSLSARLVQTTARALLVWNECRRNTNSVSVSSVYRFRVIVRLLSAQEPKTDGKEFERGSEREALSLRDNWSRRPMTPKQSSL